MSEAQELVRKIHPEAFQSSSGRVWTSKQGFYNAVDVKDCHPTQTEWYLGDGWPDAVKRLEVAA